MLTDAPLNPKAGQDYMEHIWKMVSIMLTDAPLNSQDQQG